MVLHNIPCLSQHLHIKNKDWRTKSCGITCLAMLLNYFNKKVSPDELLEFGLKFQFSHNNKNYFAYIPEVGWTHWGLVKIAEKFGLSGNAFDWSKEKITQEDAYKKIISLLKKQPVMASIKKNFEDGGSGHLIVLTGFDKNNIFYNNPDHQTKDLSCGSISKNKFLKYWTKRVVVILPDNN